MTIISIYWDPYFNDFSDIEGNLFYDIFRIITPNKLLIMKKKRGILYEKFSENITYELVFPLEEDDLD